jgi:hypothetical protein
VCPKTESPTNACFQSNPLAFANAKTTIVYKTGRTIPLDAVDVTEGVQPAGHAWRRLPLPACACDLGTNCQNSTVAAMGGKADNVAYFPNGTAKAHGNCKFGLQFDAPHLFDGTWEEGYGYYVAELGDGAPTGTATAGDKKKKDTGTDICHPETTEAACTAQSAKGCVWYVEQNIYIIFSVAKYLH